MKTKKMTTGQIAQLLEIDRKNGIFARIQALIVELTDGGVKIADPRQFFQELYDELFPGKGIVVPALPETTADQEAALKEYAQLMWFYFPAVTEKDFPASFVKPAWGKYITEASIERKPMIGHWALVDTVAKPNYDDKDAYSDQLTNDLGLKTRFNVSWNDCAEKHFPAMKKLLAAKEVRHMTAEEWNFFANVMNTLRVSRNMDLPDLGSTRSVEWCLNGCGSESRLCVGTAVYGGLTDVGYSHPTHVDAAVGFRFLAIL